MNQIEIVTVFSWTGERVWERKQKNRQLEREAEPEGGSKRGKKKKAEGGGGEEMKWSWNENSSVLRLHLSLFLPWVCEWANFWVLEVAGTAFLTLALATGELVKEGERVNWLFICELVIQHGQVTKETLHLHRWIMQMLSEMCAKKLEEVERGDGAQFHLLPLASPLSRLPPLCGSHCIDCQWIQLDQVTTEKYRPFKGDERPRKKEKQRYQYKMWMQSVFVSEIPCTCLLVNEGCTRFSLLVLRCCK